MQKGTIGVLAFLVAFSLLALPLGGVGLWWAMSRQSQSAIEAKEQSKAIPLATPQKREESPRAVPPKRTSTAKFPTTPQFDVGGFWAAWNEKHSELMEKCLHKRIEIFGYFSSSANDLTGALPPGCVYFTMQKSRGSERPERWFAVSFSNPFLTQFTPGQAVTLSGIVEPYYLRGTLAGFCLQEGRVTATTE